MVHSEQYLLIWAALLVACSTQDIEPRQGALDAAADARVTLPAAEASPGPSAPDASGGSYPIDPNGPPPDCILPCVWEAMKRCPGPEPGQACVADWTSLQRLIECCPIASPTSNGAVQCDDDNWVRSVGSLSERIFEDGTLCWRRHGEAMYQAPGPPLRAADWTTTWYASDEAGAESRIATVEHSGPMFPGPVIGKGVCYEGDEVAFTADVDVTVEHCRKWFPKCDVPGICPLPLDLRDPNDAGSRDAAPDATTSPDVAAGSDASGDAARLPDARPDG